MESLNDKQTLNMYIGLLSGEPEFFKYIEKKQIDYEEVKDLFYTVFSKEGYMIHRDSGLEPVPSQLKIMVSKKLGLGIGDINIVLFNIGFVQCLSEHYECICFVHDIISNLFYSIYLKKFVISNNERVLFKDGKSYLSEESFELDGSLTLLNFESILTDYGINFVNHLGDIFGFKKIIKFIKEQ